MKSGHPLYPPTRACFKKGSGTFVRSTRPTFGRCPAVPAKVPDPFLKLNPRRVQARFGVAAVPSLFVIRGADQGTRFELDRPAVGIGRDSSNAVQLHDTEVSRRHAEILRADDTYTVTDLDSSNGTFVNGQRVSQQRLESGDHLQIGRTLMLFTRPSDESDDDAGERIDISVEQDDRDKSRIIHSVTQEESSRLFDPATTTYQDTWLARARSNLQIMYRTALAVSHTLDIDQLLQRIMELIFEWVEADRGCIMLLDAQTKSLDRKAFRSRASSGSKETIRISKTILDYVMERGEGVLTSDARQDDRWNPAASILQMGIREAICVPMQGRYDVVGVIYIDTSTPPQDAIQQGQTNKFTEDHLKLMVAIGHQAALAVEDTRYYSAMVQAERLAAVGQTIATLSHHIKNILQGIRGGSYLIEMGLSDHDESLIGKGWNIVEKNQAKISTLVMDMLTFSKEREPDLQPAQINQVVADAVELLQSRAEERNVELRWTPAENLPTLIFDPEGMHRAVVNVVTNAIDAASEAETPGLVEVLTEYSAEEAQLRVIVDDNGSGIPPEHLETLFNPFVSHKKGRGTGLGLAVSKKILSEHGGRILVDSVPGSGSRFTLELAAVEPESGTRAIDP
jgi:signal transduction histidine kinase